MAKKILTRLSFRTVLWFAVIVAVSIPAYFLSRALANYNDHLNRFSFYAKNADKDGAAAELANIKNDYLILSRWQLKYFADTFLLNDLYLYEAEADFLNENYEEAIDRLKGHENDPRALYLMGISKFRVLYSAYHSDAAKRDESVKKDILKRVIEEVSPDFEGAVKKGPGPSKAFNYSYDYDLASDEGAAKKAMEGMPKHPQYVLGIKDQEGAQKGKAPGKKKDKEEKRVDDPTAGQNDTRKKG